jgi:hypothetical protein
MILCYSLLLMHLFPSSQSTSTSLCPFLFHTILLQLFLLSLILPPTTFPLLRPLHPVPYHPTLLSKVVLHPSLTPHPAAIPSPFTFQ